VHGERRPRPGTYARARVRELDRALLQALNRACALDYQLPRARVRELAVALAADLRRLQMLAAEFEPALAGTRVGALVEGFAELDVALVDDIGHLPRSRALARRLAADLDRFRSLADEVVAAWEQADTYRRPALMAGPAGVAAGLVAQAVRVLPADHRARWREEFDAELRELADTAVSRWAQVGHAVRVTGRAWLLRRALLARAPAEGRP
jgi:hypothetical protein